MITRFCLYSIFKNLRFFEPFFVFYLLIEHARGGVGLSYLQIGALVGCQKLVTGLLEIPSGVATDRWGRRRALILCFGCYVIAFPIYGISSGIAGGTQIALLYLAQTVFGIGEAFRTGSHKAIMLDWLDETGRSNDATRVVGLTRFFSKASAGLSALAGGAIVYATGGFTWLFWASTAPALLGVVLMRTYPGWLEGEMSRMGAVGSRPAWRSQLRRLWTAPGVLVLMIQSVMFEGLIKLTQIYIQPFLNEAFRLEDIRTVGGVGALLVGGYYFVHDLLGGTASFHSGSMERRLGGGHRANQWLYVGAAVLCGMLGLCLRPGWIIMGLVGFVLLTLLQNARRPIFVSLFNRVMDKPQRATILSIESQARSWLVAALAPITGYAADRHGLPWAFALIGGVMALGLLLRVVPTGTPPFGTPPPADRSSG